MGTETVDVVSSGGDIAAHHAARLAERPFDDGKAARRVVTIRYAADPRAVHADRMHLVQIGERVVLVGKIADRMDRPDVAVHRIDAFNGDQLWRWEERSLGTECVSTCRSRWSRYQSKHTNITDQQT